MDEKEVKICKELAKCLDFVFIQDHVSDKSVAKEMYNDYLKAKDKSESNKSSINYHQKLLINCLIKDNPRNIRVITTSKGFGIESARSFVEQEVILMYFGVITLQEHYDMNSEYVLLIPGTRFYADAKFKGSLARYINHSCKPNCHWETRWFNGKCYPVLVALQGIGEGVELTYDYKFQAENDFKNFRCLCGAGDKFCRQKFASKTDELLCGLSYDNINGKLVMTENVCTFRCKKSADMYEHRFSHHYAGDKMMCAFCLKNELKQRVYSTLRSLTVHLNRHHVNKDGDPWGANTVKYPCSQCSKWTFFSPKKWQQHLIKCTAEPNQHNKEVDNLGNSVWETIEDIPSDPPGSSKTDATAGNNDPVSVMEDDNNVGVKVGGGCDKDIPDAEQNDIENMDIDEDVDDAVKAG